jgi:hypothetical protein
MWHDNILMHEKIDISVILCTCVLFFIFNKDCVFSFPLGLGFPFPIRIYFSFHC